MIATTHKPATAFQTRTIRVKPDTRNMLRVLSGWFRAPWTARRIASVRG